MGGGLELLHNNVFFLYIYIDTWSTGGLVFEPVDGGSHPEGGVV